MLNLTRLLAICLAGIWLVACQATRQSQPTIGATIQPPPVTASTPKGNPSQTLVPDVVTTSAIDSIRASGEVRVGVLYNYPPFSYRADNGDLHGYEIDLASQLATKWGANAVFVPVTRQTRIPFLAQGKVDMLAGAMPHQRDLGQLLEFSATTYLSGYALLVANETGIDNLAAIGSNAVGAVGSDAQTALLKYSEKANIAPTFQSFTTLDEAINAFSSGALRVLAGRREDMMRASSVLQNTTVLADLIEMEPYAFAVRRGDTPMRDLIDLTLNDLARDGSLGKLYSANLYGFSDDFLPIQGEVAIDIQAFPATISVAESAVGRLRRGEPLRVGGLSLAQQAPAFDSQPIIDGYNRAVLNEMARRWNAPLVEVPQSAGEAGLTYLKSGQVDIVAGFRPDAAQIGLIGMSLPYYKRYVRMIHLASVTIFGIDDLNYDNVTIVDPIDVGQDLVQKNSEFAEVQLTATNNDAFNALAAGSTYAIVGDEFAITLMAKADTRFTFDERRYRPTSYVMALPADDADFTALVNFTLQDMKADGTLDRLQAQYLGPYASPEDSLEPMPMEIWPGDGSYLGVGS